MASDKGRHVKPSGKVQGNPAIGDGNKGGKKPKMKEITQRWPNGTIMGNLTRRLWKHKG